MLVLDRKKLETIVISENITITVVKLNDHRVKLAIEAPRDINIRRGELPEEDKK